MWTSHAHAECSDEADGEHRLAQFALRRDDWRTFRLDRLSGAQLAGGRYSRRDIPGGDGAAFVAASMAGMPRELETLVAIGVPYDHIAETLRWIEHTPVETGSDSCTVRLRADKLEWLVMAVARIALSVPVTVIEPSEVAEAVDALVARISR